MGMRRIARLTARASIGYQSGLMGMTQWLRKEFAYATLIQLQQSTDPWYLRRLCLLDFFRHRIVQTAIHAVCFLNLHVV